MKNTAQFAFLELVPSVAGNRDVVCDLPLYSTGSAIVLGLTSCSRFHWLLKTIRNVIVEELNLIFITPLLLALVSSQDKRSHSLFRSPHNDRTPIMSPSLIVETATALVKYLRMRKI